METATKGNLTRYDKVESAHVDVRHVDVWTPPGYDTGDARYPVLYMHDGQNLFDPALSYGGVPWGVDIVIERDSATGEVRPAIVVGIWNTPRRISEYMPQKPLEAANPVLGEHFARNFDELPISDAYLRFLVEELKPRVDARYRTLPGRDDTFVMGSSMGGLISLYAICEYPHIFGGAGCLSTSWTVAGRVMEPYLREHLPDPATHRIYFDYGGEAQIGRYEQYQRHINVLMAAAGYRRDRNWTTRRFPGAPHSEQAWHERLDVPLKFLLSPEHR